MAEYGNYGCCGAGGVQASFSKAQDIHKSIKLNKALMAVGVGLKTAMMAALLSLLLINETG